MVVRRFFADIREEVIHSSNNGNETTLTVTDPTADRTITLPNETGTLITSASAATNAFSVSIAAALG